jgi:hypothetical protein
VLALAPKSTHGRSGTAALSAPEKSKTIPSGARQEIEMQRAWTILQYDHHTTKDYDGNQFGGARVMRRSAPLIVLARSAFPRVKNDHGL